MEMNLRKLLKRLFRRTPKYDPTAWSKLGNDWDNNFSSVGWSPYRVNILDWVMELEDECDDMLDVGCHIGHYIQALRERGYNSSYYGIDITPEFIERARKLLPKEYFGVGDCRTLPFLSMSFDLVMCVGVLMHLLEIETSVKELFRVANKYVLLSTYGSLRNTYENHRDGLSPRWLGAG
jgi:SAM-dependent methyltransferase